MANRCSQHCPVNVRVVAGNWRGAASEQFTGSVPRSVAGFLRSKPRDFPVHNRPLVAQQLRNDRPREQSVIQSCPRSQFILGLFTVADRPSSSFVRDRALTLYADSPQTGCDRETVRAMSGSVRTIAREGSPAAPKNHRARTSKCPVNHPASGRAAVAALPVFVNRSRT